MKSSNYTICRQAHSVLNLVSGLYNQYHVDNDCCYDYRNASKSLIKDFRESKTKYYKKTNFKIIAF